MFASPMAARMDRHAFADAMLRANGGQWPDMEGLIRDLYVAHGREGDSMLDVGVNHGGHFNQMAEAVGRSGHVIGFEAAPELVRRTWDSIHQHYPHLRSRVTLHPYAVSDKPGEASFYFSKMNDSGLSGLANRSVLAHGEVEEIKVELRTIDSLVDDAFIALLRFAKFDIEGAEYHAFKGAERVLRSQPILAFEWDVSAPRYFSYRPEDLFNVLSGHAYRIFDLFGFEYRSAAELVDTRVWNFVGIPFGMDAAHVLRPSIDTLANDFPDLIC